MSFKLYLATKNPSKVIEIRQILRHFDCEIILPDVKQFPDETGKTFQENALTKALHVAKYYPGQFIAGEDSGLIIPAAGGLPGIYSSRFSGKNANDGKNIKKLLKYLENLNCKKPVAYFICVVALIEPSGKHRFFEGRLYGRITETPRGSRGFGYDPIFELPEYGKTVAELPVEEKNKISHRAKAFKDLAKYIEMAV